MGIYHSTTVGVGFEVPLEVIHSLPNYEENGEAAQETLDDFLYSHGYSTLSYAVAHEYDALDTETQFVICVNRLTDTYSDYENYQLVILDTDSVDLTQEEIWDVERVQNVLFGESRPVVQFVASSVS